MLNAFNRNDRDILFCLVLRRFRALDGLLALVYRNCDTEAELEALESVRYHTQTAESLAKGLFDYGLPKQETLF